MKSSHLRLMILCLAGAAAGAGLGWISRGFHPAFKAANFRHSEAAADSARMTENGMGRAGNTGSPPDTKPSGDSSKQTTAQQAGALRWLHLLGAAEMAKAADMPGLLRLAGSDMAAVKLLAQRWAELDAPHFFRHICGTSDTGGQGFEVLRDVLFEEWPKRDAERSIAALNDTRLLPGMRNLRWHLTNTIMKNDPQRGLRLLKEWEIRNYQPDMSSVDAWAAKDPRAAAENAAAAGPGADNTGVAEAMRRIGKAWAATDPAAALDFAREKRTPAAMHLMRSVLGEWTKRDPAAAMNYVSGQTDSIVRGTLGNPLVEEWAKTDPQAAMTWAAENLKGEARMAAAAAAVKSMAEKDVSAAAEYVAGLTPGGLKNRAVAQLAQAWIGDTWNIGGASSSTPESREKVSAALTWMNSLPETDAREQAFEQSSWRLFPGAAAETIAFLESETGGQAPQSLFNRAAQHLAKNDPEAALKWTENLSAEKRLPARQGVLSEWIASRPDAAAEWVRGLPAGEERSAGVQIVSGSLSGEKARVWRESLPAQDREAIK